MATALATTVLINSLCRYNLPAINELEHLRSARIHACRTNSRGFCSIDLCLLDRRTLKLEDGGMKARFAGRQASIMLFRSPRNLELMKEDEALKKDVEDVQKELNAIKE